jgi:hypothetical protein
LCKGAWNGSRGEPRAQSTQYSTAADCILFVHNDVTFGARFWLLLLRSLHRICFEGFR